jgi:hypothetical protein
MVQLIAAGIVNALPIQTCQKATSADTPLQKCIYKTKAVVTAVDIRLFQLAFNTIYSG